MPEDASSPASSSSTSESSQTERGSHNKAKIRNGAPQTPYHRRGHSEPHDAFSPTGSPKLPSPMTLNLYRLGIGSLPLSPLRRQFSSSFSSQGAFPAVTRDGAADADDELSEHDFGGRAPSSDDEGDDDDLSQDSKDVLVDRLNDLLQRLSTSGSLEGANITTLHVKVDEMEKVLSRDHRHKPARPTSVVQRRSILQLASPLPIVQGKGAQRTPDEEHHPDYWGFSKTPPRQQLAPAYSELSIPQDESKDMALPGAQTSAPDKVEEPGISSKIPDIVVAEAEKLCMELKAVVKHLQDRREESDHIHEMLVDRAEAAAKRILELEDYVAVLEDEISANKSDLEHLRLQLRAVEVLCYEYVPPDADRDLLQSIENWKSDYTRLKVKMAARKRERNPLSAAASPSASSIRSPNTSVLMEGAGLC